MVKIKRQKVAVQCKDGLWCIVSVVEYTDNTVKRNVLSVYETSELAMEILNEIIERGTKNGEK